MTKRKAASPAEKVSSREAVETAIEKSKDGREANWERPTPTGYITPKWDEAERSRISSPSENCDR